MEKIKGKGTNEDRDKMGERQQKSLKRLKEEIEQK